MDNVRRETRAVSVMIPRLETDARGDEKEDHRPLLQQKLRHRLSERYPQKFKQQRESPSGIRGRIPCRNSPRRQCTNRHVIIGTLPCLFYMSDSGCEYGDKCPFRNVEVDVQPSKKVEEKWCERVISICQRSPLNRVVCLMILIRGNRFQRVEGNLRSNHALKLCKGTWHHIKIRE